MLVRRAASGLPIVIICSLVLGIILVSCGSRSSAVYPAPATPMLGESPSALVKAFLAAANEERYSDAQEMLSEGARYVYVNGGRGDGGPVLQPLPSREALGFGFRGICDQITKNGSITKVVVVKENIVGEAAGVTVDLTFKDGSILKGYEFELLKEGGAWKQITLERQVQPQE
jgi:hypothetical protein